MKKLIAMAGVGAALALGSQALAVTNTYEIYPSNFQGLGIPGAAPHGNLGGWRFGTTTNPTFSNGSSTAKPSPGDGRGSLWWGNDGGAGDALIGSNEVAGPLNYNGKLLKDLQSASMTYYKSSTPNNTGVWTGMLWWMRTGGGTPFFVRFLPDFIEHGRWGEGGGVGSIWTPRATMVLDSWVTVTINRNERVLETNGNAFGAMPSDLWDGTGSPNNKMTSLAQLEAWDPGIYFSDTGWPVGQSVELSNNVHGNLHETWLDKLSFTWGSALTWSDGDATGDGAVNIDDLSILASNWNGTVAAQTGGDATGDGVVNIDDLSILASNWNSSGATTTDIWQFTDAASGTVADAPVLSLSDALSQVGLGGAGVPEPSSLALLIGGGLLLARRRRA